MGQPSPFLLSLTRPVVTPSLRRGHRELVHTSHSARRHHISPAWDVRKSPRFTGGARRCDVLCPAAGSRSLRPRIGSRQLPEHFGAREERERPWCPASVSVRRLQGILARTLHTAETNDRFSIKREERDCGWGGHRTVPEEESPAAREQRRVDHADSSHDRAPECVPPRLIHVPAKMPLPATSGARAVFTHARRVLR